MACSCQKSAGVGRRKTTRKATTRKTTTKRRRVAGVAASPATIMVAGIGRYKKAACSKTKSAATATADAARASGQKARVVKSGTTYCVYTRGKANPAATKRKAAPKRRTTTRRKAA